MKNRPARVRELIQRELGAIIAREMNFTSLVTIQAVDLTADFKHSHVHVGVLGSDREQKDVIHALAERRPYLQHELSKRVILKYTPQLHFHLDHSVERGTKVMEILRQLDEVTPAAPADDAADPEDAPAPVNARAARDAADMEAEDLADQRRQEEAAARREIETDGADDAQDETFGELAPDSLESDPATTDKPAAKKEDRPSRPSRGAQNRTAREASESDE